MTQLIEDQHNIIVFALDMRARYIYANDTLAAVAQMESPQQMYGKTHDDFVWRPQADSYLKMQADTLESGASLTRQIEMTQFNRQATYLCTETVTKNAYGEACGVMGCSIDITDYNLIKKNGHFDQHKKIFYLGSHFNNDYLTQKEFFIFQELLKGNTVLRIAHLSGTSIKTIQSQIKCIVRKLQCSHKSDIVPTALRLGLVHAMYI